MPAPEAVSSVAPSPSPAVPAPAAVSPVTLGRYVGYWFDRTPRRALYCASYYKFAARLIGRDCRVLDVGCSEGLGTWLLASECGSARGIDPDEAAVRVARENWRDPRIEFECGDFLDAPPGEYGAVVNFDVIEHIFPRHADDFLARIGDNLVDNGMAVVGTPSLEGQAYASEVSKAGHVNVYSGERLEAAMRRHFRHVFMFAANDEVVHTGFLPMAHYLIAVGCIKRATR
jgi:SAM-dependent methyltransferase